LTTSQNGSRVDYPHESNEQSSVSPPSADIPSLSQVTLSSENTLPNQSNYVGTWLCDWRINSIVIHRTSEIIFDIRVSFFRTWGFEGTATLENDEIRFIGHDNGEFYLSGIMLMSNDSISLIVEEINIENSIAFVGSRFDFNLPKVTFAIVPVNEDFSENFEQYFEFITNNESDKIAIFTNRRITNVYLHELSFYGPCAIRPSIISQNKLYFIDELLPGQPFIISYADSGIEWGVGSRNMPLWGISYTDTSGYAAEAFVDFSDFQGEFFMNLFWLLNYDGYLSACTISVAGTTAFINKESIPTEVFENFMQQLDEDFSC